MTDTRYQVVVDGDEEIWLATSLERIVEALENRYPNAERIGVYEVEHGACLFAKWRAGAEIKTAWGADVDQHEWTNDKVPSCNWCGEWTVPLRNPYADDLGPPEYECEDCFSPQEDGPDWDDLGPVVNEWALIYARGVDSPDRIGYGNGDTTEDKTMP